MDNINKEFFEKMKRVLINSFLRKIDDDKLNTSTVIEVAISADPYIFKQRRVGFFGYIGFKDLMIESAIDATWKSFFDTPPKTYPRQDLENLALEIENELTLRLNDNPKDLTDLTDLENELCQSVDDIARIKN